MTSELSDPSDLGIPDASPYIELDRGQWSALASSAPLPLTQADVEKLRGLGDPIDLAEVDAVYRPLTALLEDYIATSRERAHRTGAFLGVSERPRPSSSRWPGRSPWANRRRRVSSPTCSPASRTRPGWTW